MITVGLAFVVLAVVFILINAIHINMSIFFSTFNRNKAFFDAEIVIDKFGTEIKNAYELARPIGPRNTGSFTYPIPGTNPAGFLVGDRLLFLNPIYCIERADTRFAGAICIDVANPALVTRKILSHWRHQLESFKYALLKTVVEVFGGNQAHAQFSESFRPTLVLPPPIVTGFNLADPDFTSRYENYNCAAKLPGPLESVCFTFRFCTRFTGVCAPNELVFQTVVLSDVPRTDVKD